MPCFISVTSPGILGTVLPCTDAALARESAQRLADLDFGAVAFGHGAELHERATLDEYLKRHRS